MKNSLMKGAASSLLALSCALTAASGAYAQTVLTGHDGSMELEGQLLSFDDENYTIQTEFGELIVRREFVKCSGEGCPGAETNPAEELVTINSLDGNVSLEGKLVDVTAQDFVIETASGTLTIQREFVRCEGAACPSTDVVASDFAVSVPGSIGQNLLSAVVSEFASSKDYSVTPALANDGKVSSLLVGTNSGVQAANIRVTYKPTKDAIQDLIDGKTSIAMTRGRVRVEDLSALFGRKITSIDEVLNESAIGLDALAFTVNPSNRIDVASLDNLRQVLSGEKTKWSQLGGVDKPINLHILAQDSGLVELVTAQVMQGAPIGAIVTSHETSDELNAAVAADPNALGVGYRSQNADGKALALSSSCKVFFENDDFSLQTGEYPMVESWYQYSLKGAAMDEFANSIKDFVSTDVGQHAIASKGMVTQELRLVPMKDQGARMLSTALGSGQDRAANRVALDYIDTASTAKRISTSLRFLTGASRLDVKAVGDIKRISEIVRSPDFEGYEFLIFGFSDSYGSFDANISLSRARAAAVRDVLIKENKGYLGNDQVQIFGVGPIAPVGCNDTATGRDLNRRVEIWVRPRTK